MNTTIDRRSSGTKRNVREYKVLLVEDNPEDAEYIQEILAEVPQPLFRVDWADRLAAGISLLSKNQFDVILLDLSLPDSQGLDSVSRIKTHFPNVPIVVLTGLDDQEIAVAAIKKGVQDYLVKGEAVRLLLSRTILYAIQRSYLQDLSRENEEMKDHFNSILSHEIRSPLTVIRGAITTLKDKMAGEMTPRQMEFIEMADRNADRLNRLIENVLTLSRLKSGKAFIKRMVVQPAAIISEVVEHVKWEAAKRQIRIQVEVPDDLPLVCVDVEMIGEVLMNLLNNAVRFAKETIVIRCLPASGRTPDGKNGWECGVSGQDVEFSVIDDGEGIPGEKIASVFEKFVQVNRRPAGDSYKGTGLGLAICKEIITRHHGEIWADSVAGKGAAFHFRVPAFEESSAFRITLEEGIRRAESQNRSLNLFALAIGNPEAIQARFGEKMVRTLETAIEKRIAEVLRAEDCVVHFNDTLFILAVSDMDGAAAILGRIKEMIKLPFVIGEAVVSEAGIRVGMASFPEDVDTAPDLYEKALKNAFIKIPKITGGSE